MVVPQTQTRHTCFRALECFASSLWSALTPSNHIQWFTAVLLQVSGQMPPLLETFSLTMTHNIIAPPPPSFSTWCSFLLALTTTQYIIYSFVYLSPPWRVSSGDRKFAYSIHCYNISIENSARHTRDTQWTDTEWMNMLSCSPSFIPNLYLCQLLCFRGGTGSLFLTVYLNKVNEIKSMICMLKSPSITSMCLSISSVSSASLSAELPILAFLVVVLLYTSYIQICSCKPTQLQILKLLIPFFISVVPSRVPHTQKKNQ